MYVKLLDSIGRLRVTAQCAAFSQDDDDGLLLLELVDVTSANEAIWSHIVKGRTERNIVSTNAHFQLGDIQSAIKVIPSTKYHKIKLPKDNRIILLHSGLSRFSYDYLLGGNIEEPSPWFLLALQMRLPYPILPHWINTLWRKAQAEDLVESISKTYGDTSVWRFRANSYQVMKWGELLTKLVKTKELTEA